MVSRLPDQSMPTAEVRQLDRVAQAKGLYEDYCQRERLSLRTAWDLGTLLTEIKEQAGHGSWEKELAKTGISSQSASRFIRLAQIPKSGICSFATIADALNSLKQPEDAGTNGDTSESDDSEDESEEEDEKEELDPEQYCARCIRIGTPVKDCKACEALREKTEPEDEKEEQPLKDDGEREVPDCLLPVFQSVAAFKLAARRAATAATALEQVEATAAHAHLERVGQALSPKRGRTVDSTFFKTAAVRLNKNCPSLVCPKCEGVEASQDNEPCSRCDGKGWLARNEVKE